ncbi:MAG: hypothetical protein NTV97_33685 [Alphaproteobacteria bacterium]|nr:hypothetical protein [Alphaproteobacteria bacterium]
MDQTAATNGQEPSAPRAPLPRTEDGDDERRIEKLRDPSYRCGALAARLRIVRDDVSFAMTGLRGARRDIERKRLEQTLVEIDSDLALIDRADARGAL